MVILAVPDTGLDVVSEGVVPQMKAGAILLTLDPAAAYAGLLVKRDDVVQAVAHPCHPSVFLERTTKEEWADTFGGEGAPQNVVAAIDDDASEETKAAAEAVIRVIYAPVIDVHWVTVKATPPARSFFTPHRPGNERLLLILRDLLALAISAPRTNPARLTGPSTMPWTRGVSRVPGNPGVEPAPGVRVITSNHPGHVMHSGLVSLCMR